LAKRVPHVLLQKMSCLALDKQAKGINMSGDKWCPAGKQECVKVWVDSFGLFRCCVSNAQTAFLEVCGNPSAKRAPVKSDAELLESAAFLAGAVTGSGEPHYTANGVKNVAWDFLRDYRAAHPEGGR
jgi:hypothetical protein